MSSPSPLHLRMAVHTLHHGGVLACASESVWGLSCDPGNRTAVTKLLTLKRRSMAKGLILVAAHSEQVDYLLAALAPAQRRLLDASWPGPTTWLLPHCHQVPPWIHGEHETVAVRVSSHPVIRALCAAWGGPLVSTSANPAAAQPARQVFQVRRYFGHELDYLLPGALGGEARPSQIRHLTSGQLVRA